MENDKMRAIAIDSFGGPEVLAVKEIPLPRAGPDQILLQVKSAGVGVWDIVERQGSFSDYLKQAYGIEARFPYVLGSEGAGTVKEVGENVTRFKVGDRVYASLSRGTAKAGYYAEYVAVGEDSAMIAPSNIPIEQSGALPIDGGVALLELGEILKLKPEEKILIFGASGGIGHLAIQLAKRMGVEVFAVASNEDGVDLSNKLGASVAVDGRKDDVLAAIREFFPDGVDAALLTVRGFDPQAMKSVENALSAMREGGRVAYPWSDRQVPPPKVPQGVRMLPFPFSSNPEDRNVLHRSLMEKLNKMIEAGSFEVHLGKTFPLEQVVEAQAALNSHNLGRIALLP